MNETPSRLQLTRFNKDGGIKGNKKALNTITASFASYSCLATHSGILKLATLNGEGRVVIFTVYEQEGRLRPDTRPHLNAKPELDIEL